MKRTLYTCMISTILATGLWSFQTKDSSLTEGAPLYITDITFFGKELLTSEKGTQTVSLYSTDGKERIKCWQTTEPPTGVATDGEKIYATTSYMHIKMGMMENQKLFQNRQK